jgi:CRISPR-associated protein Csb2
MAGWQDAGTGGPPTGFRWRLFGPPGPAMVLALRLAEAVRAVVYRHAELRGAMPLPDTFHGDSRRQHAHAHWLVEDADGDGLADHVLLHAPAGLPPALLPALTEGGMLALRLPDGQRLPHCGTSWRMVPEWMGRAGPGYLVDAAPAWRSITPFVTPLPTWRAGRPRPGRDVATQLCAELALRGLPSPDSVEVLPGEALAAGWIGRLGTARSDSRHRVPPLGTVAAHALLRFAVPVQGPLALGFGAHFGLGLFAAEADVPLPRRGGEIVALSEMVSRTRKK